MEKSKITRESWEIDVELLRQRIPEILDDLVLTIKEKNEEIEILTRRIKELTGGTL